MTTVNADYTILQIVSRLRCWRGNAAMSDGGAGQALTWRFAILATLYRYHGEAAGTDLLRRPDTGDARLSYTQKIEDRRDWTA